MIGPQTCALNKPIQNPRLILDGSEAKNGGTRIHEREESWSVSGDGGRKDTGMPEREDKD